jgi:hypothetical protein
MKMIRNSILCVGLLLLAAPMLYAQNFSTYRAFTLGMSTATVLIHTAQTPADVKSPHGGPSVIQELSWSPPNLSENSVRSESVGQILFSFFNGELYKITVTYDLSCTEGLTVKDLIDSVSATYGPATTAVPESGSMAKERFDGKQELVASWEDSQNSLNLVRSTFTNRFGLVIFSKKTNEAAELAVTNATKIESEEGPKREAARVKKQADDLEAMRLKNKKAFRP